MRKPLSPPSPPLSSGVTVRGLSPSLSFSFLQATGQPTSIHPSKQQQQQRGDEEEEGEKEEEEEEVVQTRQDTQTVSACASNRRSHNHHKEKETPTRGKPANNHSVLCIICLCLFAFRSFTHPPTHPPTHAPYKPPALSTSIMVYTFLLPVREVGGWVVGVGGWVERDVPFWLLRKTRASTVPSAYTRRPTTLCRHWNSTLCW